MTYEGSVMVDFLYEMWAYQYPKAAFVMLILWLAFLCTNITCIVDFGWVLNHWVVGISLCLQYYARVNYRGWVELGILTFWFALLGGALLHRVIQAQPDKRYEELGKSKVPRPLFFFIQYELQAILLIFTATPLYFVFRNYEEDNVRWNFIVGGLISIVGICLEALSDYQLRKYKNSKAALKKAKKEQENQIGGNNGQTDQYSRLDSHPDEDPKFPGVLKSGLWKRSRHPNLFFELLLWTGFAIAGLNDYTISFLGFLGPIFLYLIMNYLTLPLTEKTMADTRPYWKEYEKETNKFLPFF